MTILNKVNKLLIIAGLLVGVDILTACNNIAANKNTDAVEIHQVTVQKKGSGMLYVDKISCSAVMQNTDTGGNSSFHCYLVGFIDSLSIAKAPDKKEIEAGKYYQFDMPRDWTALHQGDSLRPVFYQSKQKLESHRNEAVLVFETSGTKEPDTLVYTDSYSMWGKQQIIINNNKK